MILYLNGYLYKIYDVERDTISYTKINVKYSFIFNDILFRLLKGILFIYLLLALINDVSYTMVLSDKIIRVIGDKAKKSFSIAKQLSWSSSV